MIELPINQDSQVKMASYMRDLFPFNGVGAKKRHELEKLAWQEIKDMPADELLIEIKRYYEKTPREYQYLAIDLAVRAKRKWSRDNILEFLQLSQTKMWWDSIDAWRKLFSEYIKVNPEEFEWISSLFKNHEIFWMRRIGIILQLGFKDETDIEYLTEMIMYDKDTEEFFIQKAIGWALRDYSKTNRDWVYNFLSTTQLSKLAQDEASKYLK
ncbi:DNA-7-methylguanine glycosylase [Companilactobacillus sp. RD055328]|uniref:DNA alkylation repair protein n=1 Tax=Companilactobacillus sp. RD055328 TaxID=2916634 RepID=UPI001FC8426D|nr:DNA alkylation repair protein [Companilactobacillus sp. RD055328]GKQ43226.1 DNA-7-methylguanine glycosylase [Companilactobacillus sp. RD055328]